MIRDSGSTTSLKTYTQNRYSVYSWKKIIDILEITIKPFLMNILIMHIIGLILISI